MAATQTGRGVLQNVPETVTCVELSSIEPGVAVDVSHNGPSGANVYRVTHEVTTRANDRSPVDVSHLRASNSTSGNTARIVVDTVTLGDLTGAVVRLYFHFLEQASGGLG